MNAPLQAARTDALPAATARRLRAFLEAAFPGDFTEDDWMHTCGGVHVWQQDARGILAHGAVVPRLLRCDDHLLHAGYVEAVATRDDARRRGHATLVMRRIHDILRDRYEIGALAAAVPAFYVHLGWEAWQGPSWMAGPAGPGSRSGWVRTPEEDGNLHVFRLPSTPVLDLRGEIVCDARSGDAW